MRYWGTQDSYSTVFILFSFGLFKVVMKEIFVFKKTPAFYSH